MLDGVFAIWLPAWHVVQTWQAAALVVVLKVPEGHAEQARFVTCGATRCDVLARCTIRPSDTSAG